MQNQVRSSTIVIAKFVPHGNLDAICQPTHFERTKTAYFLRQIAKNCLVNIRIIPRVIGGILEVTGDVAIDVIEGLDENLLKMLSSNELDVVIGAPGTAANRSTFDTVPLFSSRTVLVVRPGHPLLSQNTVSLADLENTLWAIPPKGGAFRNQIEALFTVNSIPFPQRIIQASSVHVLKRIVASSDAVTLAAEQVVRDEVELGRLSTLLVEEPIALRIFGLHTRHGRELSDLGKLFCKLTTELSTNFGTQSDAEV